MEVQKKFKFKQKVLGQSPNKECLLNRKANKPPYYLIIINKI